MERKHFPAETVAEAYLALLADRGVRRLFVNAGTDFAPIVEAYGHQKESGLELPDVVVCPHENLAVSMAHGAYLAEGKPQAVMLHTSVGTANGVCAIFNAGRDRVPIVLTAGRTPIFEDGVFGSRNGQIHWAQEMYDQASMVREFVKWDYELRGGPQVETVVDRAIGLAMTEPRGPVYLTLPREVLAAGLEGIEVAAAPPAVASAASPEPAALAELADLLAAARFPVVVTAATGEDPGTVERLNELCDRFDLGVMEQHPRFLNVAGDHPLHLGYQLAPVFAEADVLLVVDVDVPWSPGAVAPRPEATVVQAGPDPAFERYPIRGHRSDLTLTTSARNLFDALAPALEERRNKIDPGRRARIEEMAAARRERRLAARDAEQSKLDGPITKAFMNWALAEVLPPGAIVASEYWASPEVLELTEPGTFFLTPPAGGLGWGLPAAMGLQLARPDKVVVATLGDGAYLFANPAACHQAMVTEDLPVLTVVCNNAKWGAVEGAHLGMYPEGHGASSGELSPLARLDNMPAFERYAEASGGYGEAVSARADLVPALTRALHAVRDERRFAVVNVTCE